VGFYPFRGPDASLTLVKRVSQKQIGDGQALGCMVRVEIPIVETVSPECYFVFQVRRAPPSAERTESTCIAKW